MMNSYIQYDMDVTAKNNILMWGESDSIAVASSLPHKKISSKQLWAKRHPGRIKEANKKYRLAHPKRIKKMNRNWYLSNLERVKKMCKEWSIAHPTKVKESRKKYRLIHPERVKASSKKWRLANSEKANEASKKWNIANPEKVKKIRRKAKARRKQFGFILLNKSFRGCEGHHIDENYVIYIPKELHRSVWHSVTNNINMNKINKLAFDFWRRR